MVDLEIDESKIWDPVERQKFMESLPEMSLFEDHIVEGDVMVEAIQALIEEGETAESLAMHWKNKGNEMVADAKRNRVYLKNALQYYCDALAYALKALELPEEEKNPAYNMPQLTSQILSNRAAVHLEMKNYSSCRSDAARAIRYDKQNVKAYYRGAKASRLLRKAQDTLHFAELGLEIDPENKLLLKLQAEGLVLVEEERIAAEQKEFERKKRRAFTEKYRQLCTLRQVKVGRAVIEDERVKQHEGTADLDAETGQMVWPMLFLYDEHSTTDFVQAFAEHDTFIEHLANMFPEDGPYCEWDKDTKYVASGLVIYAAADVVEPFRSPEEWHVALSGEAESDDAEARRLRREELHNLKTQRWLEVSPFCTLHRLLSRDDYVVPGIPVVNVFVRNSPAHLDFLRHVRGELEVVSES
ncbi:hypothetical protein P43SY_009457 [Pythium insidiosum]|uniref:Cns1/TTC4 wheel domain-containing protein n=1 Tax=Pythium insidiosum TaxID=114742 RepID=A0AAD5LMZ6_PYTIN|nr:hypothetical protein P43SY_009457 [Pythium insidiosum]